MPTLNWLGDQQAKHTARRVPYRLLETVSQHGDVNAQNWLIQGDNLDALKALLPFYAGKVKCIFIDPPYNTKSAFEHYDDNLEHSQWLSMMYPRLELLRELLSEDGSIWITIDDNEAHYLKLLCDEIFGRMNFLCDIAWEKRYAPPPDTKEFGYIHDHMLVYRKSKAFARKLLPLTEDQTGRYKNPDNDSRGPWKPENYTCRYSSTERPNLYYPVIQPNTKEEIWPKTTRVWAMSREVHEKNVNENRIWWGKTGKNAVPSLKNFMSGINQGMMPMSIWKHTLAGHTQEAAKEMMALFGADKFSTPKPERLIETLLKIATEPNDFVLDSYLGSGTTAAVAHKMGRRWIGVEMGEHSETHCLPRLKKVIEGEQGGVSKNVRWQGGGGFRYMKLGEPVFLDDGSINPDIRFNTLASYVWFLEIGQPHSSAQFTSPLLGITGETENAIAYVLLFNGILGDRRANGGNVLTSVLWPYLQSLAPKHKGRWVIYGEAARMTEARRRSHQISFKQIPYDIRMK